MTSDHKFTSKGDMIAAFPDFPAMIKGETTMQEFLRTLQNLMVCAQSHKYSLSTLNLIHVRLSASLYAVHIHKNHIQKMWHSQETYVTSAALQKTTRRRKPQDTQNVSVL